MTQRDVGQAVERGTRVAPGAVVILTLIAVSLLLLGCAGDRGSPPASRPVVSTPAPTVKSAGVAAIVDSVVDGDTIRVLIGGRKETVRIIGLDSPESRKPDTPVECFAAEASRAAERLIRKGSVVTLEQDPTQDTRDRFGRMLAHVILADGTLFAETMIRGGYAVHYVYDGVPSIYADRLAAAQVAAEATKAGLWAPEVCGGNPHAPSVAPSSVRRS